jgi:hypothetical protein
MFDSCDLLCDIFQGFNQRWKIRNQGLEYNVHIKTIIIVNHYISHANHCHPREIRIHLPCFITNAACGFSYDFKAAYDRILALNIGNKLFNASVAKMLECNFGGFQNIDEGCQITRQRWFVPWKEFGFYGCDCRCFLCRAL